MLASLDLYADILRATVALFIIVDPIGLVPVFSALTKDLPRPEKKRMFRNIVYTGSALLLLFALAGQQLLLLFGISLQSFMIAGGMLLLLLSVEILLRGERVQKTPGEDAGIVPIAFPLLVGPGAITTTMISIQSYGLEVAIPSILIVMFLTWVVLRLTDGINRLLGRTGSAVVARVMAVFIAAIAIQFIIEGIQFYYPPS
ncbi:MAG TPA: MarC family protein [Candidatus Bathyarchaeia archaeon]|nr:MarC family protein [Candidatus Bathyarchaeia archaeon]